MRAVNYQLRWLVVVSACLAVIGLWLVAWHQKATSVTADLKYSRSMPPPPNIRSGSARAESGATGSVVFAAQSSKSADRFGIRIRSKLGIICDSEIPYEAARYGELCQLFKKLDANEIQAVLALSLEPLWPTEFRDAMRFAAYDRWLELDPATALQAADGGDLADEKKSAWLRGAITSWATQSPEEALAFLPGQKLGNLDSQSAYSCLAEGAAKLDSDMFLTQALAGIQDPELKKTTVASVIANWSETKDVTFVNSWIATLPAGEQLAASAESAVRFANSNPEMAATVLTQLSQTSPQLYNVTATRVLLMWAQTDPAATAAWFAAQASAFAPDQQSTMLAELLQTWKRRDEQAPLNWVAQTLANGTLDKSIVQRAQEGFK